VVYAKNFARKDASLRLIKRIFMLTWNTAKVAVFAPRNARFTILK
jgi:hypothetical protein